MEKKKVLALILSKIMINTQVTGTTIKCMEWESTCLTIQILVKDTFTLESSTTVSSMVSVNLFFFKIKMIKKVMLCFKVFGKTDKKMVMVSIFTVKTLLFIMKVIGKVT